MSPFNLQSGGACRPGVYEESPLPASGQVMGQGHDQGARHRQHGVRDGIGDGIARNGYQSVSLGNRRLDRRGADMLAGNGPRSSGPSILSSLCPIHREAHAGTNDNSRPMTGSTRPCASKSVIACGPADKPTQAMSPTIPRPLSRPSAAGGACPNVTDRLPSPSPGNSGTSRYRKGVSCVMGMRCPATHGEDEDHQGKLAILPP